MAKPKAHAWVTLVPFVYKLILAAVALTLWSVADALAVLFLGFLIDVDHLSWQRIKKLRKGDTSPVSDHLNYFHSWGGFLLITAVCLWAQFYLAFSMYVVHMLMDGCNRDNGRTGLGISQVPKWIFRHTPEWARYGRS